MNGLPAALKPDPAPWAAQSKLYDFVDRMFVALDGKVHCTTAPLHHCTTAPLHHTAPFGTTMLAATSPPSMSILPVGVRWQG